MEIKNKILALEHYYLTNNSWLDIYLITLTSNPEFFLKQEDGQSFSKTLEEKTKELSLFLEAFNFSLIKNKKFLISIYGRRRSIDR